MLRGGDYACLVQGDDNTIRQGIAVAPRLLDLAIHRASERTQSIITHA